MNIKGLSILSFLQSILITITIISINIGLYRSMQLYDSYKDEFPQNCAPISVKVLFYMQIQQNIYLLYLIPIVWFMLLIILNNAKFKGINQIIGYFSWSLVMILLIFIIVDSSYMPQSLLDKYWVKVNLIDYKCKDIDNNLWQYIEKYLVK